LFAKDILSELLAIRRARSTRARARIGGEPQKRFARYCT